MVPASRREPRQPMPKRVGSSAVNMISSMLRVGWWPISRSERMASSPPNTPTTPSYFPALGMASVCDPVATAGSDGSLPGQVMKRFPTASLRVWKPAFVARSISQARAAKSSAENNTRVTAGAGCEERVAR